MHRCRKRAKPRFFISRLWIYGASLLLIFSPAKSMSQLSKLDSLRAVLDQDSLAPGEKVFTLGRLAVHHYFDGNPAAGDRTLNEAIELATALSDKQYLARTLAIQAMQLRIRGEIQSSEASLAQSLKALDKTDNFAVKAYVWYAKGWLESRNDANELAVESFMNALRHYDEVSALTDSDKTIKAAIYNELFSIYGLWDDFSNMEKYARLSLDNAYESGDKDALSGALYSLGYSFEQRYRSATKQADLLDSAKHYYQASIAIFHQYRNRVSSINQLPFNAIGLANLYSEFYPITYKDSAQIYLDIAIKEGLNTKQYTAVANAYGIMNEYAQRENRWDDAEKYLLRSASYIQQEEMPSIQTLSEITHSLAAVYEQKGDFKSALKHFKEYVKLHQTRYDNEKMAIGRELEVKYESELKEQKLLLLEEQVAHRKKLNAIYIMLALITLIALLFLWLAFRQRTNAYKQQRKIHQIELERINQEHKISLLSAMIDGQEKERARIARDLHDGLGGLLSSVKIMLSGEKKKSSSSFQNNLIDSVIHRIDQAVDELRRIAKNMMPEILLNFGLMEALKEYTQTLKKSGINVTFQAYNFNAALPSNKQVVVYRVAQELVNNAIKYAQANHILIELRQEADQLSLLVEDDGKGFDIDKLDRSKGSGLGNVEARSVFLNGQMHIDSQNGVGTTAILTCPTE